MDIKDIQDKLNKLFRDKIMYKGKFDSLVILEKENNLPLRVKFLKKQHYDVIMDIFREGIKELVPHGTVISHLNFKTVDISVIAPKEPKRIEVSKTLRTSYDYEIQDEKLKKVMGYMIAEYRKVYEDQKQIREEWGNKDCFKSVRFNSNYGKISAWADLYAFLKKLDKEYNE